MLFIGSQKYLEARGAQGYFPTALIPMLGKCAKKLNLGELFLLGEKSTEEIEIFRKCLPETTHELFGGIAQYVVATTPDELWMRCDNPDVCIYKGVQ